MTPEQIAASLSEDGRNKLKMLYRAGRRGSAVERFWRSIEVRGEDECWLWTKTLTGSGYGRLHTPWSSTTAAHRVAILLDGRDIPKGMVVDHICRARRCVNPKHLRVVTPAQNALENSVSIPAKNAAKTHCKNGHELAGDNLHITCIGGRQCRTCAAAYQLVYQRERYRRLNGLKPEDYYKRAILEKADG